MTTFASMQTIAPDSTLEESSSQSAVIHVVAAAIRGGDGRYLLTRRRPGTHLAGFWEFPGGKCELGESVESALVRELNEELGIIPTTFHPLIKVTHHYPPDTTILLDVWVVSDWSGEPVSCEGQAMAWVAEAELHQWQLSAADLPVIQALRYPPVYLITPPSLAMGLDAFYASLDAALLAGVRLVVARIFDFSGHAADSVLTACHNKCQQAGARLLRHSSLAPSHFAQFDGLHLSSVEVRYHQVRPVSKEVVLGVSCHNLAELRHAESIDADFAVLSPVLATPSHPGQPPMGWPAFAALAEQVSLPVYALGGMSTADLELSRCYGGHGIAGIRLFLPPDQAGEPPESYGETA